MSIQNSKQTADHYLTLLDNNYSKLSVRRNVDPEDLDQYREALKTLEDNKACIQAFLDAADVIAEINAKYQSWISRHLLHIMVVVSCICLLLMVLTFSPGVELLPI